MKAKQRGWYVHPARLTGAGNTALNFLNTLYRDGRGRQQDCLHNYGELVYWCQAAGLIGWDWYMNLDEEGFCYEREAKEVFESARTMRALLRELLLELTTGAQPDEFLLRYFKLQMAEVNKRLEYSAEGACLVNEPDDLKGPLWLLVWHANALITGEELSAVKQCPLCGSLFVDRSRRHNRKWCSEALCGSAGKSARYYERKALLRRNRNTENEPIFSQSAVI